MTISRSNNVVWVASTLALAVAATVSASAPSLETAEPRWLQRGEELEIKLVGERLDTVSDLLLSDDAVQLVSYRAEDGETAYARLRAETDCAVGEKVFWLVGEGGLSGAATIGVGDFDVRDEAEPNNTEAEAETLPAAILHRGVSIQGGIEEGDVDCFRVELAAGEHLGLEVNAMRLGVSFLDAYVDIVDPRGKIVASCDDSTIGLQDPMLSYVAQADGVHLVRVREAAYGGDYESRYVLHLGDFPAPVVAMVGTRRDGGSTTAVMRGDAAGEFEATLPTASTISDWIRLRPRREEGSLATPTASLVRIGEMPTVSEQEPNDTPASGTESADAAVAFQGQLAESGDVDCFRVPFEAGKAYEIEAFAERIGAPIDVRLAVFGPNGELLSENDDRVLHDSRLVLTPISNGVHTIRVDEHLQRGGPTACYRVEVRRPRPQLDLAIPVADPLRPSTGQTVVVARRNRFAMPIAVRRAGFAGDVTISVGNLPTGVTCSPVTLNPTEHLAVLLFEAAESAGAQSGFVDIVAEASVNGERVMAKLTQDIAVVIGEPRQTVYHSVAPEATPIAVIPAGPFTMQAETPAASLARDGALDLQVTIERDAGFYGEVTLTVPKLPAWIECTEEEVVIPPGESSISFPLYAGDRAIGGDATLVVRGEADWVGGRFESATQRVPIAIRDPYANVEINSAAAEQGRTTRVVCPLQWLDTPGADATAILRGLPKGCQAEPIRAAAGDDRIEFVVQVGDETPIAAHNTLLVELVVPEGAGKVRQYLGRGGVLEVLAPGAAAQSRESRLTLLRRRAGVTSDES